MMALKLSMQQKTIMPKLYELTHHAYLSMRSRVLIGTKLLQSVIDSNIMNGTCQLSIKNQDTKEGSEILVILSFFKDSKRQTACKSLKANV